MFRAFGPPPDAPVGAPLNIGVITQGDPVLVWDETDVLTVLEVIPEVEHDSIWHRYVVREHGIELTVTIYQYDADVWFEMRSLGIEKPIFSMRMIDCPGIARKLDATGEYLEFAASRCFGSRYDGDQTIPYGVRIYIKPTINVALFG
ncbi:Ypar14, superfamily integron cassette [Marinobacter sp. GN3S48]|uniref:Ypar14, super integron cassette n=1 Tax=Marinobacter sp. GN3S48 TaxID=3382302 RepID=UPI00387ABD25